MINEHEAEDEQLVSIRSEIENIYTELPYATTDNFFKVQLYDFTDPQLRRGTIRKLKQAQKILNEQGYSLKVWDGFRPYRAQCKMWDIYLHIGYVSNPKTGYLGHSRGNTIDVTLVLKDGTPVEMPSGFDDFTERANRDYSDASEAARKHAVLLETAMEKSGFNPYYNEWWHFSDKEEYPIIYDD